MILGFSKKQVLPTEIIRYLTSKGCEIEDVEADEVPRPCGGNMLCVNILPAHSCWLRESRGWERIVCLLLVYLVKRGFTRNIETFQTSVNIHRKSRGINVVLITYGCDSALLRELERHRYSLFSPISRMDILGMIDYRQVRDAISYSKYLLPHEYLGQLNDDQALTCYLLCCGVQDWLNLSEIVCLVRKTTSGQEFVDRSLRIVRCLLEYGLMHVGGFECDSTVCQDLPSLIGEIQESIRIEAIGGFAHALPNERYWFRNAEKANGYLADHSDLVELIRKWIFGICEYETCFRNIPSHTHCQVETH